MAGPQYATTQVLQVGPSNQFYVAGIKDANGNIAQATTNFKQRPSGLLIPEPVDANGIPLTTSRITSQITSTALAASATYTQPTWQDAQALAVTFVGGSVYADQAGTLYVDFSDDGTNVAGTSATSLAFTPTTAGTANATMLPYPVEIPTRYFRFRYVNGSTAQATFALYQTPMAQWSPRTVGLSGSLVPAFNVSNLALTASGTITGATYTAPTTGKLLTKFLLADPAITNPTSPLTLAQASGSSSLTATTYYVAQAQTNANGSTTIGDSLASIAVSTAGNVITTSVELEPGATGVNIYVGTTNTPLELGNISSSGTITYSGGLSSGLAVTVSGTSLAITISAPASSTGAATPTANTTAAATILSQTVTPPGGTAATGTVNQGSALQPGTWWTWEQPMNTGESVAYSLGGAGLVTAIGTFGEV